MQPVSGRRKQMRSRTVVAVLGVLSAASALVGCSNGMPRTSANVTVCTTLARVLESKADVHLLAGLAFESNLPVSEQIRQDIATYVALAAQGVSGADDAAAKAENDCASIDAPVAPGFG
jgi:hypothetical protein